MELQQVMLRTVPHDMHTGECLCCVCACVYVRVLLCVVCGGGRQGTRQTRVRGDNLCEGGLFGCSCSCRQLLSDRAPSQLFFTRALLLLLLLLSLMLLLSMLVLLLLLIVHRSGLATSWTQPPTKPAGTPQQQQQQQRVVGVSGAAPAAALTTRLVRCPKATAASVARRRTLSGTPGSHLTHAGSCAASEFEFDFEFKIG